MKEELHHHEHYLVFLDPMKSTDTTLGSKTPKQTVGVVATSINGKKAIPANYNSIGEAIQSFAIQSEEYIRLEDGSFYAAKADLSKEENYLAFWPMWAGE